MISVIIVTYNRQAYLEDCLNSIFSQSKTIDFEIIVIDNHSSDATLDILNSRPRHNLKLITNNTRVSLSEAKGQGIKKSQGDIIAFIDDDCIACEHWLEQISGLPQQYDFMGGITLPYNIKFPRWWSKSLDWMIGVNTAPGKKYLPLGSNVVFRKYVLDGLKNNHPIKELLPYGEDNHRINMALAAGFSMGIDNKLAVYHQIPKDHLLLSYLIKRSYREGRSLINYNRKISDIAYNIFMIPLNLARSLLFLDLNYLFRIIVNASFIFNLIHKNVR